MAKKATTKKRTVKKAGGRGRASAAPRSNGSGARSVKADGKHLVIVESPTKAKTINKYLGRDYIVMASVGHVRDLPASNPKGVKQEVPGVDVDHDFAPTYEILPAKRKTVSELKRAAKVAADVWFATDLDREGEAIAWHLAQALGVPVEQAKRVVFNAITKKEIEAAFSRPRNIDENKVDAQQARRILDRIVGYQVSPFLWKKVAGGLSAGRVQSVATRLVVQREREIEAFMPDEYWKITSTFATELDRTAELARQWRAFIDDAELDKPRVVREKLAWLSEHNCIQAELIEFEGKPFKPDNRDVALKAATALGFDLKDRRDIEDPEAKGPAQHRVRFIGEVAGKHPEYRIRSIETKRTTTRPNAPFITSTMQQAAANQLGFSLDRTMRIAQQLYEGIDIHGAEGQTGLITYMRTDSTHISGEALNMARGYIGREWGEQYLPEKPNFYSSSNKAAQEAHEAIRPAAVSITPRRVRKDLTEEQFKLYRLIWERFLASQMTAAQWDSTTILIEAGGLMSPAPLALLKATGRKLVFDGFLKAVGIPAGNDLILPQLAQKQPLGPMQIDPSQHFTAPPPRYTEASLQKKLEEEGIGRPSTYAPIISTIQARKYVQQVAAGDRRLMATDLGKVVTDMLTDAFPKVMDVAYTRAMEEELDKIEDEHHDWVTMLRAFYGPFKESLDRAHEEMTHAKAVTEPAPYKCAKCDADTMYRFGKNGRFLSCNRYPDCDYAAPIDIKGRPMTPEKSDIVCSECGGAMTKRTGRFGPFLGCENYPECKGIVKLDPKKGTIVLPKPPPLTIDLKCPKCDSPLNMRRSKRGPWLSCSRYPKCRGRLAWSAIEPDQQEQLEKALAKHEKENPVPHLRNDQGQIISEGYAPVIHSSNGNGEAESQIEDAA